MKKLIKIILVMLALFGWAIPSYAQATHVIASGSLPASCTVGDVYVKTSSTAGFYRCKATDTWERDVNVSELLVTTGKTLSVSNSLTITATDGSTVAFGTGGTVLYSTAISDVAYDATTWNSDGTTAPSRNAVRDKFEALPAQAETLLNKIISGTNNTISNVSASSALVGFIPVANICTATNADNTHFLRGDCTWQSIAGGGDALVANNLSQFAATTSAELAGNITNETGTALLMFNTDPTVVRPVIQGVRWSFAAKTADYTVLTSDHTLAADATGTNVTITFALPTAASVAGREFTFVRTDSDADGLVVLDGNSSETIDGAATYSMAGQTATTIQSNGTNWITTGSSGQPLADPGADRIVFWDESSNKLDFLTLSGCSITTTVLTCAGGGTFPGSATDNAIVRFDGTGGSTLQNSVVTISDGGVLAGLTGAVFNGTTNVGTFTLSQNIMFTAASCQGSTATVAFDLASTIAPSAGCVSAASGSGDPAYGYVIFPSGGNDTEVHGHFKLPSDWTGAVDVNLTWSATSLTTNDVVWQVQFGCSATGEVPSAISFNNSVFTAVTNLDTTALRLNAASKTGITTTGCSAGETAFFIIHRDTDTSGDTLDQDVYLIDATFVIRRAIVAGG